MKTIHKLVLKAYLGPMVLTFFIVMFVLMMNIVWRYIDELVGKGLSAGIIIELMTYFMANMFWNGIRMLFSNSVLSVAMFTKDNSNLMLESKKFRKLHHSSKIAVLSSCWAS